jgi:hypothetical protein
LEEEWLTDDEHLSGIANGLLGKPELAGQAGEAVRKG